MAGMVIIVVLVLIAVFAPSLVRFGETDHAGKSLTPPNSINWAGTDVLGRDVFSRIMLGTRISLASASSPWPLEPARDSCWS